MDLENLTRGLNEECQFMRKIQYGHVGERYITHIDRVMKLVNETFRASKDYQPFIIEISYYKCPMSEIANARSSNLTLADLMASEYEEEVEAITDHNGISIEDWNNGLKKIIEKDKLDGFIDYFTLLKLRFKAKILMKKAVPDAPAVWSLTPTVEQLDVEGPPYYEDYGIIEIEFRNSAREDDTEMWDITFNSHYNIWFTAIDDNEDTSAGIEEANSKQLKAFLNWIDKSCAVQLGEPTKINWPVLKRPGYLAPSLKEVIKADLKVFPKAFEYPEDLD